MIFSSECRDQSRYVPSQWETSLQCNDVSYWLGANLDWSLIWMAYQFTTRRHSNGYAISAPLVALTVAHVTMTWWRHQMEIFSALLAICAGNSTVPVISPHKGQWRAALMLSLICAWLNGWVNNREAGDLRRYVAHYDVIVMRQPFWRPLTTR